MNGENKVNEDNYVGAVECMSEMEHQARIWGMIAAMTEFLNDSDCSYDEFYEVIGTIDHYVRHAALVASKDDGAEINLDDGDGWFVIPKIGKLG